MQTKTWTFASIQAHQRLIESQLAGFIPIKPSALKEAHARGLHFTSEAAQREALKQTPGLPEREFDTNAFVARLGELTDDTTAEVTDAVLGGVTLDISVSKRSEARQRAGTYTDVAYDVDAKVGGMSPTHRASEVIFHLPVFGIGAAMEPYRLDSAHDYRAEADFKMRHRNNGNTRVAKLVDGRWYGGLYIYAAEHQRDDTRCIRSVKAALVRAILPALPLRVRCAVFAPDNYQPGRAWRVEIRVPDRVWTFWNGSPFLFDVPRISTWIFQTEPAYRHGGPEIGRFVDGVWRADLYSNGVPEVDNTVRLKQIKRHLLQNVNETIAKSGYR